MCERRFSECQQRRNQSSTERRYPPYPEELYDNFTDIQIVHQGRNFTLCKAYSKRARKVQCLKIWPRDRQDPFDTDKIKKQIEILNKLSGVQGVQKINSRKQDKYKDHIVINFEYYPNGTLIELMSNQGGKIQEDILIKQIITPTIKSLAEMHKFGITHRSIQPENIIFDEKWGCHLIDFKYAQDHTLGRYDTLTEYRCLFKEDISLSYVPYEVIEKLSTLDYTGETFQNILSKGMDDQDWLQEDYKADTWGIGCLIFEALTGQCPFQGYRLQEILRSQQEVMEQLSQKLKPQSWNQYDLSENAIKFFQSVFQLSVQGRPLVIDLLKQDLIQYYKQESIEKNREKGNYKRLNDFAKRKLRTMGNNGQQAAKMWKLFSRYMILPAKTRRKPVFGKGVKIFL